MLVEDKDALIAEAARWFRRAERSPSPTGSRALLTPPARGRTTAATHALPEHPGGRRLSDLLLEAGFRVEAAKDKADPPRISVSTGTS